MCLGELAEVIETSTPTQAVVTTGVHTCTVSLLTLTAAVEPGDWVLVHSGFALARLTPEEAGEARELRSEATNTIMEDSR